jgi:hypothetical protein
MFITFSGRADRRPSYRLVWCAIAAASIALLIGGAARAEQAAPTRPDPVPSAADIIRMAVDKSGGRAWADATTNRLEGSALLCRAGAADRCVVADRYVMYRVYPRDLKSAHTGTGKFRLDAYVSGKVLFQSSFDGTRSYDQSGPVPPEEASNDEANAFGFSAIRFALEEGFKLQRLVDDDVEGHAAYFVKVTDPGNTETVFGIDKEDGSVRYVGWQSPRGWHHRIYSDFYWVDKPHFRQPGRVRLYYSGVKTADIRWTKATIDEPIADEVFVLPSKAQ